MAATAPNPIVFLTAVSQRTKTMRLVTGAVLPVFNHPFKLAGEIAMLDGISGGRLDVGFARAFLPHEFRRFGISPDESQARFREGLEQIELLLTQENATHRGQFSFVRGRAPRCRGRRRSRGPNSTSRRRRRRRSFEFAGRKGYCADGDPDRADRAAASSSTASPGATPAIPATAR